MKSISTVESAHEGEIELRFVDERVEELLVARLDGRDEQRDTTDAQLVALLVHERQRLIDIRRRIVHQIDENSLVWQILN